MDISERGRGLGLILNYARIQYALEKGSVYVTTLSENVVARKNLLKVGFKLCGILNYRSFFSRTLKLEFIPRNDVQERHIWWGQLG